LRALRCKVPIVTRRAKAPRGRKAREPLTRARIVETALELIDADGLEALSMRRLGARLGVEAMALYHHFASKGELLDAVLERLLEEVEIPPRGERPPLERLRHFARSHRQMALRHPNAFLLVPTRRFSTERSIARYEEILTAFADLGFDAALSARYFRTMGYLASGAGQADIAGHGRQPDATPVRLETFSDPRYPLVTAVVPHLRATNLDAIFEFGLDVIFSAMKADAEAHFARSFKEAFGLPPHRYLLTRRIERATALLLDTDLSITEIAFRTGWSSLGTFGRTFRDVTGDSPRAVRARQQAEPPPLHRVPLCVLRAAQRPDLTIAVSEKRRREAGARKGAEGREVS